MGLCLSGGGFRAALYGLGVLRYLAEANVLGDTQVACGVSGGSVAAAALGDRKASRGDPISASRSIRDPWLGLPLARRLACSPSGDVYVARGLRGSLRDPLAG